MYVGTDNHVHEIANGQDVDFNSAVGAPAALPGTEVVPYERSDNRSCLYYRDSNKHVIEVASNFQGSPAWIVSDLTSVSGAPDANGALSVYRRTDGRNVIVFKDSSSNVIEIASNFPNSPPWVFGNLLAASGETVSASSDPYGYQRVDSRNAVVYVGTDGKLHELSLSTSGGTCSASWCTQTISVATSPSPSFRPFGYTRWDSSSAVVYISNGTSVRQVKLPGIFGQDPYVDQLVYSSSGFTPDSEPFGNHFLLAGQRYHSIFLRGAVSGGDTKGLELFQVYPSTAWNPSNPF